MPTQPLLSIIIVSYNTQDLTLACIQSVLDTIESLTHEIIVIDNHSSDDSVRLIKQAFGNKVRVLQEPENLGFGKANNKAVSVASGTFLLFLNSDTHVQPNALQALVHVLEDHSEYGAVTPALLNPDGTYQPQGGALPTIGRISAWWLWPFAGSMPFVSAYQDRQDIAWDDVIVDRGWIGATAMLIRRASFEKIGGFDEQIFMYAEDVDLCLRLHRESLQVGIVPASRVIHYGSASGSGLRAKEGEISGLLYIAAKYFSPSSARWISHIVVIGAVFRYLLFGILMGSQDARLLYLRMIKNARMGTV